MKNDQKLPVDTNGGGTDFYSPIVLSAQDYYPFGMLMPERRFSSDDYRFGFNGQERDDEIKGTGNSINFSLRMYDPRLGRFMAVDPLVKKYPIYSPYHFSSNQPIHAPEWEGAESSYDLTSRDPGLQNFFEKTAATPSERQALTKMYNDATYGWVGDVPSELLSLNEISGVTYGEDLDGNSYNRSAAGGILLLGFVPGGNALKPVLNVIKSATRGLRVGNFASKTLLNEHFLKHADEFGGKFRNAEEYAKGAQDFFKREGEGILEYVRENGELIKYDKANNIFGIMKEDGTIKTMFKPDEGLDYFQKQIKDDLGDDAAKAASEATGG